MNTGCSATADWRYSYKPGSNTSTTDSATRAIHDVALSSCQSRSAHVHASVSGASDLPPRSATPTSILVTRPPVRLADPLTACVPLGPFPRYSFGWKVCPDPGLRIRTSSPSSLAVPTEPGVPVLKC